MATAEECRQALESLTGRIAEMDPEDRQAYLVERVISCKISDLGVTFVTKLSPDGASPVREANGSEPPAQVRFTAKSDDLVAIASDPGIIVLHFAPRQIYTERSEVASLIRSALAAARGRPLPEVRTRPAG